MKLMWWSLWANEEEGEGRPEIVERERNKPKALTLSYCCWIGILHKEQHSSTERNSLRFKKLDRQVLQLEIGTLFAQSSENIGEDDDDCNRLEMQVTLKKRA
ncbi:hypothetical protein OIU76_028788 [Salix suchowensis]|nr:hypothetical protein OIU76_028788 [Salix suchowensis]